MILRILNRCSGNGTMMTKRLFTNHEMAYSEKRLIGYPREQMFDIVADVREYRHFIPWCRRSDIIEVQGNSRIGELEIGFPPLNESYRCRIIVLRPSVVHVGSTILLFNYLCGIYTIKIFPKPPSKCMSAVF
ncbi:polyketide cyclase/dehydrase [Cooperia oncophora]